MTISTRVVHVFEQSTLACLKERNNCDLCRYDIRIDQWECMQSRSSINHSKYIQPKHKTLTKVRMFIQITDFQCIDTKIKFIPLSSNQSESESESELDPEPESLSDPSVLSHD